MRWSVNYKIIGRESGNILFDFENKMASGDVKKGDEWRLFCLGVLFHRQLDESKLNNEDSEDEESIQKDEHSEGEDELDISLHSDGQHNIINRVISEMKESELPTELNRT